MTYVVQYIDYEGNHKVRKFSNKGKAQTFLADVQSEGCIQAWMYEE